MKNLKRSIFFLIILALVFSTVPANAQTDEVNWEAFSKNLVMALKTDNEGLQLSAMGMIIRYGDRLDVDDAVFDIVRIFRLHKNSRVRVLAMVALHKTQNDWAMYYLTRNMQFETDECVKKQCCRILNSYYAGLEKQEQESQEELLASDK